MKYSSHHQTVCFKVTAESCEVATLKAEPMWMTSAENSQRSNAVPGDLELRVGGVGGWLKSFRGLGACNLVTATALSDLCVFSDLIVYLQGADEELGYDRSHSSFWGERVSPYFRKLNYKLLIMHLQKSACITYILFGLIHWLLFEITQVSLLKGYKFTAAFRRLYLSHVLWVSSGKANHRQCSLYTWLPWLLTCASAPITCETKCAQALETKSRSFHVLWYSRILTLRRPSKVHTRRGMWCRIYIYQSAMSSLTFKVTYSWKGSGKAAWNRLQHSDLLLLASCNRKRKKVSRRCCSKLRMSCRN
jgi:hypothetical protein